MVLAEIRINDESTYSFDTLPASLLVNHYETYKKLEREIESMQKNKIHSGSTGYDGQVYYKLIKIDLNAENYEKFIETYGNFLYAEWKANPLTYIKGYEGTMRVMRISIALGDYSKDSETFKQTCKALKIKHTYKAISEFIGRK